MELRINRVRIKRSRPVVEGNKVQLISVENVSHEMISDDQILPPGNLNLHFGPDGQLKCEHLQESTLIWASENFITWPGWMIE